MTSTFHIRDKTTGLYYNKFISDELMSEMIFSKKGYGKSFKDIGKLKVHLLGIIGIFVPPKEIRDKENNFWRSMNNSLEIESIRSEIDEWHTLHPGYRNIPDYMYNRYPLDEIPTTLEIVEIKDKATKDMVVLDFDLCKYTNESKRLRLLTDNHGSAVRDIYKKLEKTNKIKDFRYVCAVRINLNSAEKSSWHDYGLEVDSHTIDEAITQMGLKRNEMIRSSKGTSVAIAFKDHETAVWFSLTYGGIDTVGLLDIEKLEEIVKE